VSDTIRYHVQNNSELTIQFDQNETSAIIYNTVIVDEDLSKGTVQRNISLHDNNRIHVRFEAENARDLRGSVKGFLDNVILASETIETFGSIDWSNP
jgi:tRNA threonylcarbamoyladenosine modification (KEOPS) complex  Pcc1 subunit